jgi:hypothetical protein
MAMDWLRDRADRLQDRLGLGEDLAEAEDQTLLQQVQEGLTLTRTQRFLGFLVCFGMGMLLR